MAVDPATAAAVMRRRDARVARAAAEERRRDTNSQPASSSKRKGPSAAADKMDNPWKGKCRRFGKSLQSAVLMSTEKAVEYGRKARPHLIRAAVELGRMLRYIGWCLWVATCQMATWASTAFVWCRDATAEAWRSWQAHRRTRREQPHYQHQHQHDQHDQPQNQQHPPQQQQHQRLQQLQQSQPVFTSSTAVGDAAEQQEQTPKQYGHQQGQDRLDEPEEGQVQQRHQQEPCRQQGGEPEYRTQDAQDEGEKEDEDKREEEQEEKKEEREEEQEELEQEQEQQPGTRTDSEGQNNSWQSEATPAEAEPGHLQMDHSGPDMEQAAEPDSSKKRDPDPEPSSPSDLPCEPQPNSGQAAGRDHPEEPKDSKEKRQEEASRRMEISHAASRSSSHSSRSPAVEAEVLALEAAQDRLLALRCQLRCFRGATGCALPSEFLRCMSEASLQLAGGSVKASVSPEVETMSLAVVGPTATVAELTAQAKKASLSSLHLVAESEHEQFFSLQFTIREKWALPRDEELIDACIEDDWVDLGADSPPVSPGKLPEQPAHTMSSSAMGSSMMISSCGATATSKRALIRDRLLKVIDNIPKAHLFMDHPSHLQMLSNDGIAVELVAPLDVDAWQDVAHAVLSFEANRVYVADTYSAVFWCSSDMERPLREQVGEALRLWKGTPSEECSGGGFGFVGSSLPGFEDFAANVGAVLQGEDLPGWERLAWTWQPVNRSK